MNKVYLTFDVETVISGINYNPMLLNNILLGSLYIAEELKKRDLKGTFFVSLSPKTRSIKWHEYQTVLNQTINILKQYSNIKLAPHLHMFNLPLSFETNKDQFSVYNSKQQIEALGWSKKYFEKHGIIVDAFRPGGYAKNHEYYTNLYKSGYLYSSTLDIENVNINLIDQNQIINQPYVVNNIKEYPVTNVKVKSIKGKKEVINLSPEMFSVRSVKRFCDEMEYLTINFHSFSVFSNRFIRELHKGQMFNNLKYLFIDKPLNAFQRKIMKSEIIHTNTLIRRELISWLDYIEKFAKHCMFIGE